MLSSQVESESEKTGSDLHHCILYHTYYINTQSYKIFTTVLCLLYCPLPPLRPSASSMALCPLYGPQLLYRPLTPLMAIYLLYDPLSPLLPSVSSTTLCLLYYPLSSTGSAPSMALWSLNGLCPFYSYLSPI